MLRQLQIASRLILLLFFFAFSGCVTSRMAANRIVTAPNRHRDTTGLNNNMANVWTGIQTNIAKAGNLSPFYYATVPVGPPAANLSILEIPAQDYHVSIVSKIAVLRNGRHTLSLFLNANTNSASSYKPLDQPATIVLLHGYMLTKESMLPWALQLSQAGYRVILVDLRGHGKSTGDTVSFGKNEVNDLRQLVDYLTARGQCDDTLGVLGFSYGATLAMHWAAHDPRISTVVAIAPYNQPDAAFERLAQELKIPINHRTAQKPSSSHLNGYN